MKLHDLFNIVVKVFGFFIIKDVLFQLPYLIPIINMAQTDGKTDIGSIIVIGLIFALYLSIAYALIIKTESILKLLRLEPQLSNEYLTFDISSANVLHISLILLSGYVLIDAVPDFCNSLYNFYEQSHQRYIPEKPSLSRIIITGIKIIVALLIIGERKKIIELINNKPLTSIEDAEEDIQTDNAEE